jgi:hypothetical protein
VQPVELACGHQVEVDAPDSLLSRQSAAHHHWRVIVPGAAVKAVDQV